MQSSLKSQFYDGDDDDNNERMKEERNAFIHRCVSDCCAQVERNFTSREH